MAHIEAICISEKKGIPKKEIPMAEFRADWGMVDDAHAGHWHRQISLLAGESIDQVKRLIPQLAHGAFAENIITRGLNLAEMKVGDRLSIANTYSTSEILLEVTQIGKECHSGCAIQRITGDCIMPREGIFARVLKGGTVQAQDTIRQESSFLVTTL